MGRDAGWIAMEATNISRDVNICLIPESEFGNTVLIEIYMESMEYWNMFTIKSNS